MKKIDIKKILGIGFFSMVLYGCSLTKNPAGNRPSIDDFEKNFRNSIINSCLGNPAIGFKKDKSKYCICYANAFVDRYETDTNQLINGYVAQAKTNDLPVVVNIMMRPEVKACEAKYGKG